jgi:hypothetical protein
MLKATVPEDASANSFRHVLPIKQSVFKLLLHHLPNLLCLKQHWSLCLRPSLSQYRLHLHPFRLCSKGRSLQLLAAETLLYSPESSVMPAPAIQICQARIVVWTVLLQNAETAFSTLLEVSSVMKVPIIPIYPTHTVVQIADFPNAETDTSIRLAVNSAMTVRITPMPPMRIVVWIVRCSTVATA